MEKQLRKSRSNSVLFGVCGGVAEFFDLNPTDVRVAWVVSCLFAGFGIIFYIILTCIVPYKKISL